MTHSFWDEDRRLIPRWRDSAVTGQTREVEPIPAPAQSADAAADFLTSKVATWRANPNLGNAADALSSGFALGRRDEVRDVARAILRLGDVAGPHLTRLAEVVVGTRLPEAAPEAADVGALEATGNEQVRFIRRSLRLHPGDSVRWVDLARWYAVLGFARQATRSMRAALTLAPEHRFTLRAATRLFIHLGEADQAVGVLRRSPTTRADPWLLAAEISASMVAEQPQRFVKQGRALLASDSFASAHTAELAGALATLELHSGSARSAKRLFALALRDPTENTVAQAEWAARKAKLEVFNRQLLDVPLSYEARAWEYFRTAQWADAIAEGRRWFADEPFSSRSAIFGSFVAGVIEDNPAVALQFAQQGLRANPTEQTLLNNVAYAMALLGKVDDARSTLDKIAALGISDDIRAAWHATSGLVAYRKNNPTEGLRLYTEAVRIASARGEGLQQAMAILNCAREEARLGSPIGPQLLARAFELLSSPENQVLRPLAHRVRNELLRRTGAAENGLTFFAKTTTETGDPG